MKLERYSLQIDAEATVFNFISKGPKGNIHKLILFEPLSNLNLFNLAFGDKDETTESLNDLVVSNNDDTEKVLTTVADALFIFFNRFPTAVVYAKGSTPSRTRLYQMGIAKFHDEVKEYLEVFGQNGDDFVPFKRGRNYEGFLVRRKFV